MIPEYRKKQLDDALKDFPELPQLYKALQDLVPPEELKKQIFTERSVDDRFDGIFPFNYILPSMGPFRVNDVAIGGNEVHFWTLATRSGSSFELMDTAIVFRFNSPNDEIKFDWPYYWDCSYWKARIETSVD